MKLNNITEELEQQHSADLISVVIRAIKIVSGKYDYNHNDK